MPTTTEISTYVTGLASATLAGTEEVYLATDEKTTVQDIANLGNSNIKVWSAQIEQTGTSNPTLNVLKDDLGVTITPSYSTAGGYILNGFDSNLSVLGIKIEYSTNLIDYTSTNSILIGVPTTSQLGITTKVGGVMANGVLPSGLGAGAVITITKYD